MGLGDEAHLLQSIARGDKQALERVYLKYKDDLISIAAYVLGDARAADDVLHDVFVSLARRAGKLKLKSGLRAYLAASCVNRGRDVLRRRRRRRASPVKCDIPSSARDPQEVAAMSEETARVVAAVGSLPPEQREVVSLHIHGGMKFREVASLLRISINTAQSRYRYALAALRKMLAEEGGT